MPKYKRLYSGEVIEVAEDPEVPLPPSPSLLTAEQAYEALPEEEKQRLADEEAARARHDVIARQQGGPWGKTAYEDAARADALLVPQGTGGASGAFRAAANPATSAEEVSRLRSEAEDEQRRLEETAKSAGYKSVEDFKLALRSGKVRPRATGDASGEEDATDEGGQGAKRVAPHAVVGADPGTSADSGGSRAPGGSAAGGGSGSAGSFSAYLAAQGIGVDYVKKFGLKLDDIKSPARFDEALRQQIAAGEVKPADAKKLSDEYKKWYSTGPGLNQRLESSQVQQQRQVDEYQLAAQESKASLADRLVSLEERAAAEADQMEAARVAAQEEYDVSMARMVADHGRLMDDIQHTQIKPFADSGGQARVGAMITALIFDAAGQALTGKQGRVLEAVDKMVDTEMRKLEFEANKKVEAAQGKMNLMQVVRQTFGDQQQARLVAKQAMYEHIASQVRLEQGKADNSQQRQGLALAADQLERKAEDQQIAFQARSEALAKEAYAAMMMRGSGAAKKADNATYDKIIQGGNLVPVEDTTGKMRERWSPIFNGYVTNEGQKQQLEKDYSMIQSALQDLHTVKEIRERAGSWARGTDDYERAKMVLTNLASKISVAHQQGAMTDDEFKRLTESIGMGGPVDALLGVREAKLNQAIATLAQEANLKRAMVGVQPGEAPVFSHGKTWIPLYEDVGAIEMVPDENDPKKMIPVYRRRLRPGQHAAPETQVVDTVPNASTKADKPKTYSEVKGSGYEKEE